MIRFNSRQWCFRSTQFQIRRYSTQVPQGDAGDKIKHQFGFQSVEPTEKQEKVNAVFENVAAKYDLMNDVMSCGVHRLWKDQFVEMLNPGEGTKLLDVAGGTGDITFRCLKHLKGKHESGSVTVCDINPAMLREGRSRAAHVKHGADSSISWVEGNAEKLPFESDSFSAYTIAFGMRNVTDIKQALAEAYRVLQPGGRFLCLEFSHVEQRTLRKVYDLYSLQAIPVLGYLVAGQWQPYQYLVESIRNFPDQESYKEMIEEAGFRAVTYTNLTFGVVAIHSGFKL